MVEKHDIEDSSDVFLPPELLLKNVDAKETAWKKRTKFLKIAVLVALWTISGYAIMANNVREQHMHQISIPKERFKSYLIREEPIDNKLTVILEGALVPPYYGNLSVNWLAVWIQLIVHEKTPKFRPGPGGHHHSKIVLVQNVSEVWYVPLVTEKLIGDVPEVTHRNTFHLISVKIDNDSIALLKMKFRTNMKTNFPLSMSYDLQPINTDNGIVYAAFVLICLYILIITEMIHRTLAAMLSSTMSIAILAALNARPTMSEVISWIDVETLLLLFSMMALVTILSDSGVFDYMSVLAYKLTNGKIWPLINTLCFITAILSCFLDNVTTVLLTTPVIIKLCEVLRLNPEPVLIYMLIFANIGGAVTPIGDPPNVIIVSNIDVQGSGVNFGLFTIHMGAGVLISLVVIYLQLRWCHSDLSIFKYSVPLEVQELRREIAVLKRTAASLGSYSRDEDIVKLSLLKRSSNLQGKLKTLSTSTTPEDFSLKLEDLERQYPLRNKTLLIKAGCTLSLVIFVFFLHSIPAMSRLGLGGTAFLGALLLMILYDNEDIGSILGRVEWSTLLFFASLFILMEALSRLGLIEWVGIQTQNVIMSVNQESRLTVAILLILWVSGIASAFVDNLPLTTIMVKIATNLANNRELGLPLQPLIWALSFGACFGGNGTLFASSSNIVCAGVAEQHGYKFTFVEFTRIGFPVMITSMITITFYLILCHVVFTWH